jgi:hypothetical protein
VDGKIGAPFAKRVLELLDEEALAADRRKRSIDDAIALGRSACQSASADSRVAIVSRRGANGAVIGSAGPARGGNRSNSQGRE